MRVKQKLLPFVASLIILSPLTSFAQTDSTTDVTIVQQLPDTIVVQQAPAPLMLVVEKEKKPIQLASAGYIILTETPLVNIKHLSDSTGKNQYLVIDSEQRAEMLDRLFAALSPHYKRGSAFKSVTAVSGTPGNYTFKDVYIVDPSVLGLNQTEPGFIGRNIVDSKDQTNTIDRFNKLSDAEKDYIWVKQGVSQRTLKEAESNGGLQIGNTIEIKKDLSSSAGDPGTDTTNKASSGY